MQALSVADSSFTPSLRTHHGGLTMIQEDASVKTRAELLKSPRRRAWRPSLHPALARSRALVALDLVALALPAAAFAVTHAGINRGVVQSVDTSHIVVTALDG